MESNIVDININGVQFKADYDLINRLVSLSKIYKNTYTYFGSKPSDKLISELDWFSEVLLTNEDL